LDALAERSEVPVSGWRQLAELFLGHLKDEEKFVYRDDDESRAD